MVTYDTPDAGSPADALTQDMPEDPRAGHDPVMRIGYEVLLRAMKAKP